ncbi:Serine/threonine-protein kinase [Actinidia chinensis var. chinensis]|uniref:Serine/threonine-protein kinase n=1 Tax=Actinidia chinensis var. chinensis TaxID=1590841 RepID=A0A2R6RTX1_ACTCC|nr:Serine/threonine-protein kinase [Actinidia chinensis var. chinensis]
MIEREDVVSVANVSESTVTVVGSSPVAAAETLVENLGCEGGIEGSMSGEDGGDIMVEVVDADVFVHGVGGDGDWIGEEEGGGLVREGLEREIEPADGEGDVGGGLETQEVGVLGDQFLEGEIETQGEDFTEIDDSLDGQTYVVADEVAPSLNEEGLEGGEKVDGGGGNASDVLSSHGAGILHEEAQDSEMEPGLGSSLPILGSSCEPPEGVTEGGGVTVSEESLERGMAVEGVEKGMESGEGGSGEVKELPSQSGGSLDDELWNPGISAAVECAVVQSSSSQTQVAEEVTKEVNDEIWNHTDESPVSVAEGGDLICSENNDNSVAEPVCVGTSNAESLSQQVEVAVGEEVGVMEEEILHPEGNLYSLGEDQQMKVETAGEITEGQRDLHVDFISSCEATIAVTANEVITVNDKVSLNPIVGAPGEVVLDGVGVDAGEIDMLSTYSGSSIQQAQGEAVNLVPNDRKMSSFGTVTLSSDGREPLTTENRVVSACDENLDHVEDQELKIKNLGEVSGGDGAACAEPQSSFEEAKLVSGNEVSVMDVKLSNSEVEIPTANDRTLECSDNDHDMQCGTTYGIAGKDGGLLADRGPSNDRACVTEIGEVAAMDIEDVLNIECEVAEVDFNGNCSGKDQYLEVEQVDAYANDVAHGDLESYVNQTQIGDRSDIDPIGMEVPKLEDAVVKDSDKVSSIKTEGLDGDACLQTDEQLNTLTVDGSMEKDGIAQGNAEASGEQTEIENPLESSVLDCQGIVQVPESSTIDETRSFLEKAEELNFETLGKNLIEDPYISGDAPPAGDHDSTIEKSSESREGNTLLQGEKQETVAQSADIHTYEVDGDERENMLVADETSALPNMDVEGIAGCQAAFNSASIQKEDHSVSSVSDFFAPLSDEQKMHIASNEVSLLDGNQTISTCAYDAVISDEMVNPEATAVSHKSDEQVPEGQILNLPMVGSLVVDLDSCLNNDGKWKPQDESIKENVSLPDQSQFIGDDVKPRNESMKDNLSLPDQSQFMGDDFQTMGGNIGGEFSELDGSATDELCLDGSSVVREVVDQEKFTDAEQVNLYGEDGMEMGEQDTDNEQASLVEDICSKQTILRHGSFAKVHQAKYLLPPENEDEFSVSDLVWGKVRSHPWWPGQIFDPADASEKATKYHKKDGFLVAYFGDRTFAWNDASLLKPFWTNFSQIEKQSNSEVFQNAVSCALEEVSRRVELGLACSCIPKDTYDKIESQIIENTGIHQDSSRRRGMDKSTDASSFKPDKLVEYIRALAQSPAAGADRLDLVLAKAQLLAFNRLKGFCQLPEFQFFGELENIADGSQLGEATDHARNVERSFSPKENSSHKRKHNLKDGLYPSKKERNLSELVGDVPSSPDGEDGSDWNTSSKAVSLSSGQKRKAVDDGSEVQERRISIYAAKVSTTATAIPKPSFKVGECIRRVASQLTGSPPILKGSNGRFQKVDGSSDVPSDVSLQTPDSSHRGSMIFPMAYSLDEMLSQLHLAARDPKSGYSFLTTIIAFFSGFRNSISLGQYSGRQNLPMGKLGGGRKKKASHANTSFPEEFEFDDVNDSYWTDRIIQNNAEEQPSGDSQNTVKYQLVAISPDKSLKPNRRSYSRKRYSNGNHEMDLEEPVGYIEETKRDNLPTELILNFSEGDSIPSEMNLNRIFRRFGPLKESETEVDLGTSRARVVFKKCSDAEVAFSSSGKFHIFGPMIINYQISYSPSISFKTLPLLTAHQDAAA